MFFFLILFQTSLIVQATDKGMPRLTGTSMVKIQVTDVNDNAPAFLPLQPVEIAESECSSLEWWF